MCDYFIQKGIIIKDFCQEIVNCITRIRNQHDDAMIGTKAIFSNNLNFESKQII